MSDGNHPTVVLVLGMHRSGTSLVTRLLNLLGVSLGNEARLLPPVEGENPTGFWEHRDVVAINDTILGHFGGAWDDVPDFPDCWESSRELTGLRESAKKLLREDFSGLSLFGWKDPRLCLTLPFWRTIVPNAHYVICLRSPVDVARSLWERDGIPSGDAFELWSQYMRAAIRNTAGQPRTFASYDRFFQDLDHELDRLARFIGRQTPSPDSDTHKNIVAFAREGLRHHNSQLIDCIKNPHVHFAEKSLYLGMSSIADDGHETTSVDREGLMETLANAYQIHVEEVYRLQELNHRLRKQTQSQAEQIQSQADEIQSRAEQIGLQGRQIHSLERELGSARVKLKELEDQTESLLSSRSWRLTAPLRAIGRYLRGRSRSVASR